MEAVYKVKKTDKPVSLDGGWDSGVWRDALPLDIKLYMGERPEHQPKTQAKLVYDTNAIYVSFRVEDNYVRSIASHQGMVCLDSCVEFFFIAGTDASKGYFNLEMNCGGNMLFRHQIVPRSDFTEISASDCSKITVYASMPKTVDPEIKEPTVWVVMYRLPFDILSNYTQIVRPKNGTVWKANFYKCADKTSHPHWLTWSKVDRPRPDFHVPESFGTLIFE